jgi:hypothetical protein
MHRRLSFPLRGDVRLRGSFFLKF